MRTLELEAQQSHRFAAIEYFKGAPPERASIPAINHSKPFYCAPTTATKNAVDRRIGPVDYQFSGSG